jgi:two-component system NtrC family sensor kinase
MPAEPDGLALVGAVAKLLNAGMGGDATVAAVAETVRQAVGATRLTLWMRTPAGASFRPVCAPPSPDPPRPVHALDDAPLTDPRSHRLALEHEGLRVGLLDVHPTPAAPAAEALPVVADLLAPYLASLELSEDLAGEVAAQSREIEAQEHFISLVIDTLPVGLYVVDRDYRIQIWNRKRETGTQGLRRGEVVGRPVFDVLTRQSREQLRAEFDRVFATGEIQQSELEVAQGDEVRHFRLSKIPMRLDGDAITHVITIGEDVTEWHAVQGQILQAEKLAAIGQLAAGVMHEINNPLATVAACAEGLSLRIDEMRRAGARVPENTDEYTKIIDQEVQRCKRIIDSLLTFSRPRSGDRKPTAVNAVIEQSLFLLKHHARFKRLKLQTILDPELEDVPANAEQLIQVFIALLINAADAMNEQGVITLRTRRGVSDMEAVVAEVIDEGSGIARSELTKIFEPFFTTKPPGRGTGLGLSVCYSIIASHGGRIEVDSAVGAGTTFRILLPNAKAPAPPAGGTT